MFPNPDPQSTERGEIDGRQKILNFSDFASYISIRGMHHDGPQAPKKWEPAPRFLNFSVLKVKVQEKGETAYD